MEFDPHGEYELSVHGEIVIMRFFRSWNIEGARQFFEDYKKCLSENSLEKFAVISDLRHLEGGTPEGIQFFSRISDWAEENGQVARAMLLGGALKEYTISLIDKGKDQGEVGIPSREFSSEEEAIQWLESLGLRSGNSD